MAAYVQKRLNADNSGGYATLVLDAKSTWNVTDTSHLTVLEDGDTTLANIQANGFDVYYHSGHESNRWLAGKIHELANGGKLRLES